MISGNLSKMEIFELFVGFIQLLSYQEIKNEVGNNDLDQKLDEQNNVYLKTIIKNQELILKKLNKIIDPYEGYDLGKRNQEFEKEIKSQIDKMLNKKL